MDFVEKVTKIKADVVLNINLETFKRKMHLINDLLYEKTLFLRLYEKKNLSMSLKKDTIKMHCKRKFLRLEAYGLMVFILCAAC